jgi:hypothetical protein
MNECRRYRTLRIETELTGAPADHPHCPDCETEVRTLLVMVRAGRALARVEPPEEAVEAGRRRLMRLLASSGGRGLAAFLALAGGVLLAGLAANGASERRVSPTEIVMAAGVGTAGAAAALAVDGAGGRELPRRGFRAASTRAARSRPFRDIMTACAPVPAYS